MADMVTKLLDMARLQSGAIRLNIEWQSIEEIIGGAPKAPKAPQGALGERRLAVHIEPGMPLVACDAVLIERVLVNLLEKAGKYTPSASPVEILAQGRDGQLRVSVRDHGPGVPLGQQERIFEKFTRGDAESATSGVGPGLDICRIMVQAHGGHIGVAPTVPHGATFTFSLPLGTPPAIDMSGDRPTDPTLAPAPAHRTEAR